MQTFETNANHMYHFMEMKGEMKEISSTEMCDFISNIYFFLLAAFLTFEFASSSFP
jgi:hypothetical protein